MAGHNITQNRMTAGRAIISALALWLAFSGVAAAEQLYVNESGWWREGCAFNASGTPIQVAVDAAGVGDSIFVWNGSYTENVDVCTAHLTLEGEGADVVTVTAVVTSEHIFNVAADYVNISGFTVTGATYAIGIYLYNVDYCNISDNSASNNGHGICISYLSSNNTLTNNSVSDNENGIYLWDSSDNTLTNNIASNNENGMYLLVSSNNNLTSNNAVSNDYGIYLDSSDNITLVNNNALGNNDYGICLDSSSNNNLAGNNCSSNNYWGIWLVSSNNNLLANNTANSNRNCGIYIYSSSDNTLMNSNASNNNWGIRLWSSSNHNTLANNTVNSNNEYGIYLWSSSNNNNIINNTVNSNNGHGIYLYSNNNNLANNSMSDNENGIYVRNADNNNISCNWVCNNTKRGFYLTDGSTDNTIEYNNIMSNGISMGGGVYHWNFYNDQADDVEAKNNYWGAADNNTIDASIYDNEEGQGDVEFYPFETEPVQCPPTPEMPAFTTADAVIALQIAAGSRPPDPRRDVSRDGSVTSQSYRR